MKCYLLISVTGAGVSINVTEGGIDYRVVLVHTDEDLATRTMRAIQFCHPGERLISGIAEIPVPVADVVETVKESIALEYGHVPDFIRVAAPSDPFYLKAMNALFHRAWKMSSKGQSPEGGAS